MNRNNGPVEKYCDGCDYFDRVVGWCDRSGESLLHDGAGYVRTDECIRVLGRVWRWGNG